MASNPIGSYEIPSGNGIIRVVEDTNAWIIQAYNYAENGDIDMMLSVLDRIPLIEMDKHSVLHLGLTLAGILIRADIDSDITIEGCQHLNAYFNERNTLENVPLYVKVIESTLTDSEVTMFLNAIDIPYKEMFQNVLESSNLNSLIRLDNLIIADIEVYLDLIREYGKTIHSTIYDLIAGRIAQAVIVDPPDYLIEPSTTIVHDDVLDNLINTRYDPYSLSLYDISRAMAPFSDDQSDPDIILDEAFYAFMISDPDSRLAICDQIGIEYPDRIMNDDIELLRKFGPCNPVLNPVDEHYDELNNRMLTCIHSDNVTESGGEIYQDDEIVLDELSMIDWFEGSCNKCNRGIRYPHYAVRMPIRYGGWTGCYCSWDCVYKSSEEQITQDLIVMFKTQLDNYGIYDRTYRRNVLEPSQLSRVLEELIVPSGEEFSSLIDPELQQYLFDEFRRGMKEAEENASITQASSELHTLSMNVIDEIDSPLETTLTNQEVTKIINDSGPTWNVPGHLLDDQHISILPSRSLSTRYVNTIDVGIESCDIAQFDDEELDLDDF